MSDDRPAPAPSAIRDAAAVILLRRDGTAPRVLMGRRGRAAAFMPSKTVFPGGAVDPDDAGIARPPPGMARMLAEEAEPGRALALPLTAIRELWEETGLRLGHPAGPPAGRVPPAWRGFLAAGLAPSVERLRFVFRAVTPPGWPRRFDARFFLAEAEDIAGDPDDFSAASDELSHLGWLSLAEAAGHDLPEITQIVLAHVAAGLDAPRAARPAPFYVDDRFYRLIPA